MSSLRDFVIKNKKTILILIVLVAAYFIYMNYIKERYEEQIKVVVQPSDENKDMKIDMSKLSRIIYKTGANNMIDFYPATEKAQIRQGTSIINDYRPKSFVSIYLDATQKKYAEDNKMDMNSIPLILFFSDFKKVIASPSEYGSTVDFKYENINNIDSIYFRFANNKILPSKGEYKLMFGISKMENDKPIYNTLYKTKFTLVGEQDEVLILLPSTITLNKDEKLFLGIKKIDEERVEVAEILFNMKENFDLVKKALIEKESGKGNLAQERLDQLAKEEAQLEEMKKQQKQTK